MQATSYQKPKVIRDKTPSKGPTSSSQFSTANLDNMESEASRVIVKHKVPIRRESQRNCTSSNTRKLKRPASLHSRRNTCLLQSESSDNLINGLLAYIVHSDLILQRNIRLKCSNLDLARLVLVVVGIEEGEAGLALGPGRNVEDKVAVVDIVLRLAFGEDRAAFEDLRTEGGCVVVGLEVVVGEGSG